MTGETDLDRLIAGMDPELRPGVHVFATLPPGAAVPPGVAPVMIFREAEGTTLVLERETAGAVGIEGVFPSRMITLRIHSALEAVGFLARVATRLAEAGISVNPVSAFHHDHLFVPADRADEALGLLRTMAAEAAGPRDFAPETAPQGRSLRCGDADEQRAHERAGKSGLGWAENVRILKTW